MNSCTCDSWAIAALLPKVKRVGQIWEYGVLKEVVDMEWSPVLEVETCSWNRGRDGESARAELTRGVIVRLCRASRLE